MHNNAVYKNSGYGIYYGDNTIFNSKILNNIIANHPLSGIQFKPSQSFHIWFNDFYHNNPDVEATEPDSLGIISKTNFNGSPCDMYFNIFLDPSFKDASNLDFELNQDSPCIDAGNPSVFYNDENGSKNDLGAMGGSALYIYPISYDFGKLVKGGTREISIEIRNHRVFDFSINSLQLSDNSNFSVLPNAPIIVPSYGMKTITVTFKPQNIGNFSTKLTVGSNDFFGANVSELSFNGTAINGTIIDDRNVSGIWRSSDSPYLVTKQITVPKGSSLTIEPGVKVLVEPGVVESVGSIIIHGRLNAIGTETDSIIFTRSHPSTSWGGIRFYSADSSSKIMYCKIEYSNHDGIHLSNSDITIKHNTIQYNRGQYFAFDLSEGGAGISSSNSSPIIANNVIRYNHSTRNGGGILCDNKVVNSRYTIENNIIYGNWADGDGGGVLLNDQYYLKSNIVFNNNMIYNNHSQNRGGGICCSSGDMLKLQNNTIYNNYSQNYGGGIFCRYVYLLLQNNILDNNSSSYGGGILCAYDSLSLVNNTIVNDVAAEDGDAVYLVGSSARCISMNNIFWNFGSS